MSTIIWYLDECFSSKLEFDFLCVLQDEYAQFLAYNGSLPLLWVLSLRQVMYLLIDYYHPLTICGLSSLEQLNTRRVRLLFFLILIMLILLNMSLLLTFPKLVLQAQVMLVLVLIMICYLFFMFLAFPLVYCL